MRTYVRVGRVATILHADLDAFYASVEQRDDPRLRGRPVIVGGGVVLAASYEAKARGVRTAMGGRAGAPALPGRDRGPAPDVGLRRGEQGGLRGLPATPRRWSRASPSTRRSSTWAGCAGSPARRPRSPPGCAREVREQVGLPITVGVARTKFLAKVASGVAKPDGLLVVPPGRELAFLHPLPVERLWGVGPVTAGKLRDAGIRRSARWPRLGEAALVSMLGAAAGRHLHALAHNHDPRPVQVGRRRRSIGSQRALGRGPTLAGGARRDAGRAGRPGDPADARRRPGGRTVVLRLRFGDFSRATRSHTLRRPRRTRDVLLAAARRCSPVACR